ncbi:DMT family transporter [Acidihalobacter ferrooxydans]|uniref:Guanidinium exporter n=1 Tax=Acidihalobacter ferrooxydans TaxID=1765967 RepID=A0A1P8ULM2_9GAMM|nr:QacE family quaternary ammonium compound efflux SMR transporter [Acidihalobacter ferrooxydans]
MAWALLLAAGVLEVVWVVFMRFSDGFTRLWPSIGVITAGGASLVLAAQAIRVLPIGTAYAVWTGIGAAGAALVGMLIFGESHNAIRVISLVLVIVGLIGLKLGGSHG